jgi:ABC-type spermidine/putrescine transport system permease subunit I
LTIFFLLPTGLVASYSCRERDFAGQVGAELSSEGWRQVASPYTRKILVRSVILAASVTGICLVLGYPCALALARLEAAQRQFWVVAIGFPLLTSQLLRIYGWLNLLPLAWRGTAGTVALVMVTGYLPFMILPLLRAAERADVDLYSAAMDLGATPWRVFWHVTWPLTRSGMWAGCALVFIPAAGEYLIPHFIGQGKFIVLGTLIVEQFMERRNWPYATAAAVCLLGLIALPVVASVLYRSTTSSQDGLLEPARHV